MKKKWAAWVMGGLMAIALQAHAAVIEVTVPEFNGPRVESNPVPVVIGTFNYTLPAGETLIDARISGTFGTSQGSSAGIIAALDGIGVAVCLLPVCSGPWSFTFSPTDFTALLDGAAALTAEQQTIPGNLRLGETTLRLTTAAGPTGTVPEPAGLFLLGSGLILLLAARKGRASKSQQ